MGGQNGRDRRGAQGLEGKVGMRKKRVAPAFSISGDWKNRVSWEKQSGGNSKATHQKGFLIVV